MTDAKLTPENDFDNFADDYDEALKKGIAVSGESKEYFAQGRVDWLSRCLRERAVVPQSVLDFGCGTGSATPYLLGMEGVETLVGIDISKKSIEVARAEHSCPQARFLVSDDFQAAGQIDLGFCNGVFHHIPLSERRGAAKLVYNSIRPGGLFALWENNPWNPGTRLVMDRCPFDKDAITLTPPEARRLMSSVGFNIVRTDFLFIFPKFLSALRWTEKHVCAMPIGAQYMVLCQKP